MPRIFLDKVYFKCRTELETLDDFEIADEILITVREIKNETHLM